MKTAIRIFLLVSFFSWPISGLQAREWDHPRSTGPKIRADIAAEWQSAAASDRRGLGRDTVSVWFDDLESSIEGWILGTGWELTEASYSSPTHSLHIDDDNYSIYSSALLSPVVPLPQLEENQTLHFSFDLWCDFPDFDGDGNNQLEDYYSVDVADTSGKSWHVSTFNAYEGKSWWCGDESANGYDNGWLQFLDSPEMTIPTDGTTTLTFKLRYALEQYSGAPDNIGGCTINGWDAANVRVSADGGETWTVISGSPSYTYTSCFGWFYNGESCSTPGWGHTSSGWGDASFDLTAYAGQSLIVRFAFGSDPAYSTADDPTLLGFFVDNISVDNSASGSLMFDNADDQVVMIASGLAWNDVFYDYGDVTRPGGAGWDSYDPGDPFNGNILLDLSGFAGSDIRLRWMAIIDDNDDGGNGEGLFIDNVHIWKKTLQPALPIPQNLAAVAGDAVVTLTWDPIETGGGGEIAYDNDDGSGSAFTNGIYSTDGTFVAAEYFNTPFGADVDTARIYGYVSNTGSATTLYGYNALGGVIDDSPIYQKSITLSTGVWNDIDLSSEGWSFEGEFALGIEVGTFGDGTIIYAPLDESAIPSTNSYVNFGSWATWQSVAEANSLPDGEWGIRGVTAGDGGVDVVYNVYRRGAAGSYADPLWYGTAWPENTFDDPFVVNGQTYYYVVTAVYNYGTGDEVESDFSNEVEATPEAETIYEIAYDDGTAELGATSLGDSGYYAVQFTPEDYPVQIVTLKYYATGDGGLTWVHLWDDDGANGMPGSQIGAILLFTNVVEGWNEKDVSAAGLVVSAGSFYGGWGETAASAQLGLDTNDPIDGHSYFQIPGDPWAAISDLGYSADLMIRAKVDAAVSIDEEAFNQLPHVFSLGQNYPNPFNPVTFIPFDLPESEHVSLTLYDVAGKEVKVLIDERLSPGRYSYQLDASDLPTGIYFCRLKTDHHSSTQKLILLK